MTNASNSNNGDRNRDPISGAPGAHPIGTGVGGLGGKAVGEAVNPTAEDAHWRSTYENEPYRNQVYGYEDCAPAESSLAGEWERNKGASRMAWQDAKPAVRAAWHRVERKLPGDADGDGM